MSGFAGRFRAGDPLGEGAPATSGSDRRAFRDRLAGAQFPLTGLLLAAVLLAFGLASTLWPQATQFGDPWAYWIASGACVAGAAAVPLLPASLTQRIMLAVTVLVLGTLEAAMRASASFGMLAAALTFTLVMAGLFLSLPSLVVGFLVLTAIDLVIVRPRLGSQVEDATALVLPAGVMAMSLGLLVMRTRITNRTADLSHWFATLSRVDPLTGLLNRRGLDISVAAVAALAGRAGEPLTVTYVDMDGLKGINDTRGHEAGDGAIVNVADVIRSSVRQGDVVARVGGDEFVVVSQGTGADHEALLERMLRAMDETMDPSTGRAIAVSVGTASGDPTQETFDEIASRADAALYRNRRMSRGMRSES